MQFKIQISSSDRKAKIKHVNLNARFTVVFFYIRKNAKIANTKIHLPGFIGFEKLSAQPDTPPISGLNLGFFYAKKKKLE